MTRFSIFLIVGAAAAPACANETVTYSYDALGRVGHVSHDGTVNNGLNQSYSHDATDNRTNVTVTGSAYTVTSLRYLPIAFGGAIVKTSP